VDRAGLEPATHGFSDDCFAEKNFVRIGYLLNFHCPANSLWTILCRQSCKISFVKNPVENNLHQSSKQATEQ